MTKSCPGPWGLHTLEARQSRDLGGVSPRAVLTPASAPGVYASPASPCRALAFARLSGWGLVGPVPSLLALRLSLSLEDPHSAGQGLPGLHSRLPPVSAGAGGAQSHRPPGQESQALGQQRPWARGPRGTYPLQEALEVPVGGGVLQAHTLLLLRRGRGRGAQGPGPRPDSLESEPWGRALGAGSPAAGASPLPAMQVPEGTQVPQPTLFWGHRLPSIYTTSGGPCWKTPTPSCRGPQEPRKVSARTWPPLAQEAVP